MELALRGSELRGMGWQVGTLYVGGGTPTALAAAELSRLLAACRRHLPLKAPAEWTVEANPGTVDREKAACLAAAGVNRISLGVQDLNDKRLALLGRAHTRAQTEQAFSLCRAAFPSVSADLMAALPGQTADEFRQTLAEVCSWGPDHLSIYGLKAEAGTPLEKMVRKGTVVLPDDEQALAMFETGREYAVNEGYSHYEIANFARPGHQSRHNMAYWHNRPYLGIGLGAHSYWQGYRLQNAKAFAQYRSALAGGCLPVSEAVRVSFRQEMEDTMMLGLRLTGGVLFSSFRERFGYDMTEIFSQEIRRLANLGLIVCDAAGIRLSDRGLAVANVVFAEFITA